MVRLIMLEHHYADNSEVLAVGLLRDKLARLLKFLPLDFKRVKTATTTYLLSPGTLCQQPSIYITTPVAIPD